MKASEKQQPFNSCPVRLQPVTEMDRFMKLVLGSTRSAEQIAQYFGAERGSFLGKLLIQICERLREDEGR
jgi:hypothetical protein